MQYDDCIGIEPRASKPIVMIPIDGTMGRRERRRGINISSNGHALLGRDWRPGHLVAWWEYNPWRTRRSKK